MSNRQTWATVRIRGQVRIVRILARDAESVVVRTSYKCVIHIRPSQVIQEW